jgi:PRTRC genetic system protein E
MEGPVQWRPDFLGQKEQFMFKELTPVIADRPLTIMVTNLAGGKIRVCIVPQAQDKDGIVNGKVGYQAQKEVEKIPDAAVKALTTPLALTGTAEELDAELPEKLTTYAEAHQRLQHGLEQATAEITEAVKLIGERNKSKGKLKTPAPTNNAVAEGKREKPESSGVAQSATLPLAWCAPPRKDPAQDAD